MDPETATISEAEKQQLPPPSYTGPFWLVPFDRNISFIGRNETFMEIDQALEIQEGSQPRVALCGLGGIGKSQVALEYCYRRRNKDAKCSIFWVNAATVARFEESLNQIAIECGISTLDGAKSDAAFLLKNWLEVQHVGPWLMVIDNLDDEDAFFHAKMTVGGTPSEYIPNCQNGSLLFTTRSSDLAFDAAHPTSSISIHILRREEGLDLVRKHLRDNQPENLIVELLEELDYVPLAITQAVAFMVQRQKTIQQYLEQYRRSDTVVAKFLHPKYSDHAQPEKTPGSVSKTWKLSFESIRDSNRKAADLLCLINFFQHHGIPAILLQGENEVGEYSRFEEATELLKAFSFIDESDSVFSTHRLVQLATRWWLEEEKPQDVDKWAFEALKSIASQFPEPSSQPKAEYFKLGEILLPHAEWILQYQSQTTAKDSEIMRAKLLASTGRYIHWNGNYDEARLRASNSPKAGGIRREVLGEDDPRTIDGLSDLAISLTGDYAESERMQREALARSKRVLGLKNSDTMNCMSHLADVLDEQGKPEEAAKLLREVYETKKDLLGSLHPDVLTAEHNLAYMLCQDDERIDEAISLYKHNLRNKREVSGPAHSETLTTAYNLITYLALNDRVLEARALCEKYISEARNIPHGNGTRTQEWLTRFDALRHNLLAESNADE